MNQLSEAILSLINESFKTDVSKAFSGAQVRNSSSYFFCAFQKEILGLTNEGLIPV